MRNRVEEAAQPDFRSKKLTVTDGDEFEIKSALTEESYEQDRAHVRLLRAVGGREEDIEADNPIEDLKMMIRQKTRRFDARSDAR